MREVRQQEHQAHCKRPQRARSNRRIHVRADDVLVALLGLLVHVSIERGLAAERQCSQRIHYEVDPENLRDRQRIFQLDQRTDERDQHRRHVDRQLEDNEFPDRIEDRSAVENRLADRFEIVVEYDDLGRFFGDFGAAAHCKADVRFFQSRRVVDAVTGHADDKIEFLCEPHESRFVCRKRARNYAELRQLTLDFVVADFIELGRCPNNGIVDVDQTGLFRDCNRRLLAIARDHHDLHACLVHLLDRFDRVGANVVANARHSHERQAAVGNVAVFNVAFVRHERERADCAICKLVDLCVDRRRRIEFLFHAVPIVIE